MSFVSKGDKKVRNMAKKAGPGADKGATKDSFGRKGDGDRAGAPHNMAPGSKDRAKEPVSEDADGGKVPDASKVVESEYDPAGGKRAKSVADLRSASKKITERSMAGEASPTGSEGGQDAKHTSSSKNSTGYMKTAASEMEKKMHAKPRGEADQMKDEMEDPLDEDEEDSGQAEEGMTAQGKSRKKMTSLKMLKKKAAMMDRD